MNVEVSAADVKALRDRTGAGMMACKAALEEAGGDPEKAIELLRVKGQASAAKRSGRATGEGVVSSYIHATGRVGVLVEVLCETDFVARTDEFRDFAREVAVHVAGAAPPPLYISKDQIPDEARASERRVLEQLAREDGKPDEILDKVVGGQISKWEREVTLLEQEHINADRYGAKTIDELRSEIAARTGENVTITRFARFEVGEE
jgi:elongation factor Ts